MYMHIYIHTYICIYIYTHTLSLSLSLSHTHTHTYRHTHTHAHTHTSLLQEKKRLAREVIRRATMHNSPTAKVMLEKVSLSLSLLSQLALPLSAQSVISASLSLLSQSTAGSRAQALAPENEVRTLTL